MTSSAPKELDRPHASSERPRSDAGWLIRMAVVAAAFVAVALWRSHEVGIPFRDPGGKYFEGRLLSTAAVFAALVVVDTAWRVPRPGWRWSAVLPVLRSRWTGGRLATTWAALILYQVVYLTYRNLKSWDVLNAPQDHLLTRVDQWLFLGHSPAVLLHDILGQGLAAWLLIVVYESFPTLVSIAVPASVALTARVRQGAVFLASMMWAWILGTASYYSIPSLGPFDDRPQDFAGLPHSGVTETQSLYLAQRAHLIADPQAHDAFAQISAFASLHVAITTVIVLMAYYYRLRRITIVLAVFLVGTLIATIYLGWHFVVDDIAGLAIGVVAVVAGRLTIDPSRRQLARWRCSD